MTKTNKIDWQDPEQVQEYHREYDRRYREANLGKGRERARRYRETNLESEKERVRQWKKNNPGKIAQSKKKLKQATPPWADEYLTYGYYEESTYLTKVTGVQHNVDHIIPIRGVTPEGYPVCGLNVDWNLKVEPAEYNGQKWNRVPTIRATVHGEEKWLAGLEERYGCEVHVREDLLVDRDGKVTCELLAFQKVSHQP